MEGSSEAHAMSKDEAARLLQRYGLKPESRAEVSARPGHEGDLELGAWMDKVNAAVRVLHPDGR